MKRPNVNENFIHLWSFANLLKVRERLVDVVLVVEAQPSHIDGVGVHGVRPQQVVGDLK